MSSKRTLPCLVCALRIQLTLKSESKAYPLSAERIDLGIVQQASEAAKLLKKENHPRTKEAAKMAPTNHIAKFTAKLSTSATPQHHLRTSENLRSDITRLSDPRKSGSDSAQVRFGTSAPTVGMFTDQARGGEGVALCGLLGGPVLDCFQSNRSWCLGLLAHDTCPTTKR